MALDCQSFPPLPRPTTVRGKIPAFRGLPCTGQNYNFRKWFLCLYIGVVPISEVWLFRHQPMGPPEIGGGVGGRAERICTNGPRRMSQWSTPRYKSRRRNNA